MRRKTGFILIGFMSIAMVGLVGFNFLVPVPAPVVKASPMAVVASVVGQVEVRHEGKGRWVEARVGESLSERDEVRSGLFSEAQLHLRGESSVVVTPNTSFVVGGEELKNLSFEVGEGRIQAAIRKDGEREVQFRSKGSDAVAAVRRGEFSLATDGKGTVLVDTTQGEVKLKAKGAEVKIRKGRRSVVLPDKAPSKVLAIPSSVALQVRWPPGKLDATTTQIRGKTNAGAVVLVNGILVRADGLGEFVLNVPLREGANQLVVTSTDVSGKSSRRVSPSIQVDTRPPEVKVDAKGLWK